MKRITKKQNQTFIIGMLLTLDKIGATPITNQSTFESFMLDTKVGGLEINVDIDNNNCYTVFTKFEDVEQAKVKFDCNPYSGKWNFHLTVDTPQEAIELIIDAIKITLES